MRRMIVKMEKEKQTNDRDKLDQVVHGRSSMAEVVSEGEEMCV